MPAVTVVSPSGGPMEGGTQVSISGSSLSDVTAVYFGGKPAITFKVVSDSLITGVTPSHDHIVTAVTLDSPGRRSADSVLDRFTFTSATQNYYFEITNLQWKASSFFIDGYGFADDCTILIDGKPAPKVKMKHMPGGGTRAVLAGGGALKAMLPKGRNVLITIDNPGDPDMTAVAIFAR